MKRSTPKISIISPVYNAEPYIVKCLDSILAQTFESWELILVDDGSLDRSGILCDEYATKDSRIVVIHKKNEGVGAARQTGMDNATGEYIIHVDPDDWVEPDMLEQLYQKAKENEFDIVICDYFVDYVDRHVRVSQQPASLTASDVLYDLFHRLHGSLCNKLARRACYTAHGVRFVPGIDYCEDVLIWVQLLQHNLKIAYLPQAFYHYVQHSGSITSFCTPRFYDNAIRYVGVLRQLLPNSFSSIINKVEVVHHFAAWQDGVISSKEFHSSTNLSKICCCKIPVRNKCACLLAYAQCDRLARRILSLNIHMRRHIDENCNV